MFTKTKRSAAACLLLAVMPILNVYADSRCVLSISPVTTLYFGVEIELPHPDHTHTIPTAHTDIEIPLRFNTGWDIHIKTDSPVANTRVETQGALFPLCESHRKSFSGSAAFQFIGVGPGQTFWHYHQDTAPAPGVDSQDMTQDEINELCLWDPNDLMHNATKEGKWLQMNLIAVRGPEGGHVSMWQESGANPIVFFSTYDGGITDEDVYFIRAKSHAHNSWAFTQPGLYEVDIQVSTWHLCDDSLIADLNNDCVVNLEDFAIMAKQWLTCGSSFNNECP